MGTALPTSTRRLSASSVRGDVSRQVARRRRLPAEVWNKRQELSPSSRPGEEVLGATQGSQSVARCSRIIGSDKSRHGLSPITV